MSSGHRGVKAARATLGAMARPRDELGAHMSIAGGLHRALERGRALDCGAVQLFLRNQRQWHARPMADAEVRAFHAARRQTGIRHVFAHASYLINLGAPDDAAWRRAVDAFTDELERAERLDLSCVVVHPGSHLGAGVASGLARVVAALDEVTRRTPGYTVRIALENTAGAGHSIGRTFEELGALLARAARPERVGVCVDTCHLFAAGYDVRSEAGYRRALGECRQAVGLERVLAFHLNDARAPLDSGLDPHEHIWRGYPGRRPLRRVLRDRRVPHGPQVVLNPYDPKTRAHPRHLALLRALRRRG